MPNGCGAGVSSRLLVLESPSKVAVQLQTGERRLPSFTSLVGAHHTPSKALRQELQLQTEKSAALRLQLDELSQPAGDDQPELRRAKQQLQLKCQQQEEELDDLAGQVSLLEQAKLRLEMSLEQLRKDHRREVAQKEEEADEARASASKKLKALEAQLETEHEERTGLLREKHQLERRCIELSEHTISTDDQQAVLKLKRDLKRTRALLKDSQAQLDKARAEASSKVQIRQLKNQVEDAEFAAALAAKARQSVEAELAETQQLLEESQRARAEAEARHQAASREAMSLQTQAEEQEEEAQQVMRRYRTAVSQLSEERQALQLQAAQLQELQVERAALQEQLAEAAVRLDALQGEASAAHEQRHLQLRVSELQSRCELELTARQRLESQTARLKETLEKAGSETEAARQREQAATDGQRRLQRQLRDITDQLSEAQRKEADAAGQARSLAGELRQAESEAGQARADLKLAFKRIGDLQNAMQAELDSDVSDSGPGSGTDDDDDDDLESFLSARLPTAGNGALGLHLESRSAGSVGSPLSPLSVASDPELRPGANGTGESEA